MTRSTGKGPINWQPPWPKARLTEIISSMEIIDNHDVTIVVHGYAVGLLPLACKKFTFLPTMFFIVGRAGPSNPVGPRSIAVSATMVVTPLNAP